MHLELIQKDVKEVLKVHGFDLTQFITPQVTTKKRAKKSHPEGVASFFIQCFVQAISRALK